MPTVYPLATRRSARSHPRPVGSGGPHPYPYHRGDVSAGREEGQGARSSSIHRPQRLEIVRSTPWVGPLRRRPAPGAVGAICTHSAAQITLRVIVAGKGLKATGGKKWHLVYGNQKWQYRVPTHGTTETKDTLQLHRIALFRPLLLRRTANYTCCAAKKGPGGPKWPLKQKRVLGLF